MNKSTWVFIAILSIIIAGGLAYRHFVQELDSRGATRLMRALEENDTEKTEDLLQTADIHARDKSGQTALFYAARHAQQPKIIYKLILAGADPLATDKHGYTPLMAAAASNPNPVIVKVLAKQGGLSVAQQHNKDKALRVAAQQNGLPVIKMLLMARANPFVPDDTGRQAADYLAENTQLSETEKTDLRQVLMLLEILEAREEFSANHNSKQVQKAGAGSPVKPQPVKKPVEKKIEEPILQRPVEKTEKSSAEASAKPTPKPIEKEMASAQDIEPKTAPK